MSSELKKKLSGDTSPRSTELRTIKFLLPLSGTPQSMSNHPLVTPPINSVLCTIRVLCADGLGTGGIDHKKSGAPGGSPRLPRTCIGLVTVSDLSKIPQCFLRIGSVGGN